MNGGGIINGFRRVAMRGGVLLASLLPLLAAPPAVAATGGGADEFPVARESCGVQGGPWVDVCRDFVGEVRLEPVDGGMKVSWTRGADDYVIAGCGAQGFFGNLLGPCRIVSQSVMSTFDPVTGTGSRGCAAPSPTDLSCAVTGLTNGVQYAFRIITKVTDGSEYTTPYARTTAAPCCSVPMEPQNVMASTVGDAADITWEAPQDWGGATELDYEVSTTPASTTCTSTVLACRLSGLDYGTTYTVNVRASNAAGPGPAAASTAMFTIPKSVPDAPAAVSARYPGAATAKVAWRPPARSGGSPVTEYVVTAKPGGATCRAKAEQRSCAITSLAGGRAYSFTVVARNSIGAGAASPPAVAGVLVNPASRPRQVTAQLAGASSATVSWQAPASNGGGKLVSYVVRSSPDAGTCTVTKRSCTMSGLALGQTYRFTVVAVNTAGRGLPGESPALAVPAPVATPPTTAPPTAPADKAPAPIT